MYVKHITNNYPSAVVVFDGYSGKPGTKIQKQARSCPDFVFGEQTMVTTPLEEFLINRNNKAQLIAMLKLRLVEAGVRVLFKPKIMQVYHCTRHRDIRESYHTCRYQYGSPSYANYRNRPSVNVKMLRPSTNKTSAKLYDIAAVQKYIGDMLSAVLFAHAVTRCDKTSAISGKGKIKAYKFLQKNVSLRSEIVNIFNSPASHPEEVVNTCERFFELCILVEINLIILMICDYTCTIVQLLDRLSQPFLSSRSFLQLKQCSANTH
ncbi:hypothetical protein PR048_001630 [Dryococelus australis]|uniref:Uncharacterized protein n=1 Tax=Dryococelus australis TaxID=614101 RepID=A0ABQ9IIY8_9NEOP|nr:hypothetical protein PR048_001630 [Dryococelus australis]